MGPKINEKSKSIIFEITSGMDTIDTKQHFRNVWMLYMCHNVGRTWKCESTSTLPLLLCRTFTMVTWTLTWKLVKPCVLTAHGLTSPIWSLTDLVSSRWWSVLACRMLRLSHSHYAESLVVWRTTGVHDLAPDVAGKGLFKTKIEIIF